MFVMSPHDRELIDYVIMPDGMIKARVEALAHDIIESWQKLGITEAHLVCIINGAF